eukprot:m.184833 g.184833  ORF g.184833 m.184833 type:complete len:70 (+) comp15563_c2_seq2:981-1190(+)
MYVVAVSQYTGPSHQLPSGPYISVADLMSERDVFNKYFDNVVLYSQAAKAPCEIRFDFECATKLFLSFQ